MGLLRSSLSPSEDNSPEGTREYNTKKNGKEKLRIAKNG